MYDGCILGLTSSSNQVSLTTKKRDAQGMVPPTRIGKELNHISVLPFRLIF